LVAYEKEKKKKKATDSRSESGKKSISRIHLKFRKKVPK